MRFYGIVVEDVQDVVFDKDFIKSLAGKFIKFFVFELPRKPEGFDRVFISMSKVLKKSIEKYDESINNR